MNPRGTCERLLECSAQPKHQAKVVGFEKSSPIHVCGRCFGRLLQQGRIDS